MSTSEATDLSRGSAARRASRWVGAAITVALAVAFVFCHGCHGGDHDDELAITSPSDR